MVTYDTTRHTNERWPTHQIAEEAAYWAYALDKADEQEIDLFCDWLRQSSAHQKAFMEAVSIDETLANIGTTDSSELLELSLAPMCEYDALEYTQGCPGERHYSAYATPRSTDPRVRIRIAIGAVLTLIVFLIYGALRGVYDEPNRTAERAREMTNRFAELGPVQGAGIQEVAQPKWVSYTTGVGGYDQITLPDGSKIQLNTDTVLHARMTADKREVQLARGEALIRVAYDTHRTLTVFAGGVSVRADPRGKVGTAFAIRLRASKSVDVVVAEGGVSLQRSEQVATKSAGYRSAPWSVAQTGEIATVRPEGIQLMKIGAEELKRRLSWTAGKLAFQGETLVEVTDEFNRYNAKQLIVVDPSIARLSVGGVFPATDPESFVLALQECFPVHVDERRDVGSKRDVILLTRAR